MELMSQRKVWVDYAYIVVGVLILAAAINMVYVPFDMVTGGVTGLAIVIKFITQDVIEGGIPLWLTNIVVNVPLFMAAIMIKGKNFGFRSLFSTLFLSVCLYITQWLPVLTEDLLLGSIFGGVMAGAGLGLVFSAFSTTGGTDLGASIIQQFIKHVSVAQIMLVLDWVIIALGAYVFGMEKTLYAIISVFICARIIDAFLDGLHFSKAAFIISDHSKSIAQNIMEGIDRGVTGLSGEGMYSSLQKNVLLCVVSKREIVDVKEIVRLTDPRAFIIVTDVREVLGEGFKEYSHVEDKVASKKLGKGKRRQ